MYTQYLKYYERDYDLALYEIKKFDEQINNKNKIKFETNEIQLYETWLNNTISQSSQSSVTTSNDIFENIKNGDYLMNLIEIIDKNAKFKRPNTEICLHSKVQNINKLNQCLNYLNSKFNDKFSIIQVNDLLNGDKKKIVILIFLLKNCYETKSNNSSKIIAKKFSSEEVTKNTKQMKNGLNFDYNRNCNMSYLKLQSNSSVNYNRFRSNKVANHFKNELNLKRDESENKFLSLKKLENLVEARTVEIVAEDSFDKEVVCSFHTDIDDLKESGFETETESISYDTTNVLKFEEKYNVCKLDSTIETFDEISINSISQTNMDSHELCDQANNLNPIENEIYDTDDSSESDEPPEQQPCVQIMPIEQPFIKTESEYTENRFQEQLDNRVNLVEKDMSSTPIEKSIEDIDTKSMLDENNECDIKGVIEEEEAEQEVYESSTEQINNAIQEDKLEEIVEFVPESKLIPSENLEQQQEAITNDKQSQNDNKQSCENIFQDLIPYNCDEKIELKEEPVLYTSDSTVNNCELNHAKTFLEINDTVGDDTQSEEQLNVQPIVDKISEIIAEESPSGICESKYDTNIVVENDLANNLDSDEKTDKTEPEQPSIETVYRNSTDVHESKNIIQQENPQNNKAKKEQKAIPSIQHNALAVEEKIYILENSIIPIEEIKIEKIEPIPVIERNVIEQKLQLTAASTPETVSKTTLDKLDFSSIKSRQTPIDRSQKNFESRSYNSNRSQKPKNRYCYATSVMASTNSIIESSSYKQVQSKPLNKDLSDINKNVSVSPKKTAKPENNSNSTIPSINQATSSIKPTNSMAAIIEPEKIEAKKVENTPTKISKPNNYNNNSTTLHNLKSNNIQPINENAKKNAKKINTNTNSSNKEVSSSNSMASNLSLMGTEKSETKNVEILTPKMSKSKINNELEHKNLASNSNTKNNNNKKQIDKVDSNKNKKENKSSAIDTKENKNNNTSQTDESPNKNSKLKEKLIDANKKKSSEEEQTDNSKSSTKSKKKGNNININCFFFFKKFMISNRFRQERKK